jgi:hypothetical protein
MAVVEMAAVKKMVMEKKIRLRKLKINWKKKRKLYWRTIVCWLR